MRRYIGITVHFISNENLHNAMLCLQTTQDITQLKIWCIFEVTNTWLFSIAAQKFIV